MMQQPQPGDYIIGTGVMHTVAEFAEEAFNVVGLNWKDYVVSSEKYKRPKEVQFLCANPEKSFKKLGWRPKTTFKELVRLMVEHDALVR